MTKPDVRVVLGTGASMFELADRSVALVMTSPPYFPPAIDAVLVQGPPADADLVALGDTVCEFAWSLRPVFDECVRVLAPGGRLVMQTRDVRLRHVRVPVELIHRNLAEAAGLQLYSRHAWRSQRTTMSRRRMAAALEALVGPISPDADAFLVFRMPGPFWLGDPTPQDIDLLRRDVMLTPAGRMPARHPHQAPLPVLRAMIRAHSRPGDLVVDPFAGGASSLRIAVELGRSAWGCEINPATLELARYNLGTGLSRSAVQS